MKKRQLILSLLPILFSCNRIDQNYNINRQISLEISQGKLFSDEIKHQDNEDILKQTMPVTGEDFKKWIPENIADLKRNKFKIINNSVNNTNIFFVEYLSVNKRMEIKITDGAGQGTRIIALYQAILNSKNTNKNIFETVEMFDNQRVLVTFSKRKSTFKYIVLNRFLIDVTGWNMNPTEMWNYLNELKVNKIITQ